MSADHNRGVTLLGLLALFTATLLPAGNLAADIRVPLRVEPSPQAQVSNWPVTVGVPFAKGVLRSADALAVVDDDGAPVACQITGLESWDDGSVRWAWVDFQPQPTRSYTLVQGEAQAPARAIHLTEEGGRITVDTGAAQYFFKPGGACFESLSVGGTPVTRGASDGFYVTDSHGRRGVLRATERKVEMKGPVHAVVRVAGEYKTQDGARNAAGVVYYHFYAGRPEVRINHKLIVSEDTNQLWFREIGLTLPVAASGGTATFNKPDAGLTDSLALPVKGTLVMVQKTYPHFGKRDAQCEVLGADVEGAVAGNWADLSTAKAGLAVQVPAFAQTFPKAFALSDEALTVKLWASEAGQELDFRTEKVIDWYFGHDWVPADSKVVQAKNNAQGTSRTHDIWVYPHAGALDAKTIANFGAVTEPVIARADPQWVADSGVLGPIHPYDPQRFPEVERAIGEHFDRTVGFPLVLFPTNGYLYYRGYPYAAQQWEVKNGQWYPTNHRLSRNLEYNFKRHLWVLAMRGGERRYFDLARDYTRVQHDMLWSNWDTEGRPTRGRLYQGVFDSPIVWAGRGAYIAFASSEDVIQFVYDYLFTGEYHSRDMAEAWIDALKRQYGEDVATAVKEQDRTDSLLRMIGSAYELHHDPYLAKFSHAFMAHTVKPEKEVGLDLDGSQIAKTGDVYSAYFYNWVHTRDPLALVALKKFAEFDYRRGLLRFMGRSSAMPFAYAMKYLDDGDVRFAGLLASWMRHYGQEDPSLEEIGIDPKAVKPGYTGPWGRHVLTRSAPVFYGLPIAMNVAAKSDLPSTPRPLADKPFPTQRVYLLLNRPDTGEATLDISVNNFGDLVHQPRLYDAQGNAAPLEVVERDEHRVTKPPGVKGVQAHKEYYTLYESFIFYRLKVPAGGAAGVHHLDLGDQVSFKVLDSTLPQVAIAAPDGTVLKQSHRYYFPVASGVTQLTSFSHRPVVIFDPAGKPLPQTLLDPREVKLTRDGQTTGAESRYGKFTVATGGRGGVYSVASTGDRFMHSDKKSSDTFFRLHNAPLLLAMDDPARLFDADLSRYPSNEPGEARQNPADGLAFTDAGKFGKGLLLAGKVISLPTAAETSNPPHARGTVEFWWRPRWSAGDFPMAESTQRLQLFHFGPVGLQYFTDNPNQGRTGNYNESRLGLFLARKKDLRFESETRAIIYPTSGQWYHIAATWNVDGANSEIDIFINGRKRSYSHYNNGMPRTAAAADLAAMTELVRLGSARLAGWAPGGDEFDELRISRSVRYSKDFEPPTQPFAPDAETWLLVHFDDDLKAWRDGEMVDGTAKTEKRLY